MNANFLRTKKKILGRSKKWATANKKNQNHSTLVSIGSRCSIKKSVVFDFTSSASEKQDIQSSSHQFHFNFDPCQIQMTFIQIPNVFRLLHYLLVAVFVGIIDCCRVWECLHVFYEAHRYSNWIHINFSYFLLLSVYLIASFVIDSAALWAVLTHTKQSRSVFSVLRSCCVKYRERFINNTIVGDVCKYTRTLTHYSNKHIQIVSIDLLTDKLTQHPIHANIFTRANTLTLTLACVSKERLYSAD